MSNVELSHGFGRKLEHVAATAVAGVFGRDPRPAHNNILREAYASSPDQYRSPRAYSNPPLELLEGEMVQLVEPFINDSDLSSLPWTEHRFSQGLHLATVISFSDQHNRPVTPEYFVPERARVFVNEVSEFADENGRQATIPEQFSFALELSEGSVLGASVISHAGTRSIARGSDSRVDPLIDYTAQEVKDWRDDVASFEAITGKYGDPPGDTYHFWGAFIAGLLSETGDRVRDKFFNPAYRHLFTNAAEITSILRYGIGRKKGDTHKEADVAGYHIGSLIGTMAYPRQTK